MKPVAWMMAASLASSILVAGVTSDADREVVLGMAAPLACAVASWVAYERTRRVAPARLTNVMIAGLVAKMLFFGVYVVVMVRVVELRPVPFMASFVSYFVALHAMEALFLRRLLMDDAGSPGEPA